MIASLSKETRILLKNNDKRKTISVNKTACRHLDMVVKESMSQVPGAVIMAHLTQHWGEKGVNVSNVIRKLALEPIDRLNRSRGRERRE